MNAKAANPGANASACAPRRASRAGAGRTHSRRTAFVCCVLAATLLGVGIALHAHRAAARDRELSERLLGPLLPGVPDIGEPLWTVSLGGDNLEPFEVRGFARAALGADLVRPTTPPLPDWFFLSPSYWLVGVGTPTESRFLETFRTDPAAREAWENFGYNVPHQGYLHANGTATNLLPDNVRETGGAYVKDGVGLRDRLVSALGAESAIDGVSFAEERLVAGVVVSLNNWPSFEYPGRFRRTVAWCCAKLDFLPLDSLADWASEERDVPSDPTIPWQHQFLSLVVWEGRPASCRMHQEKTEIRRQLELSVDASEPLAAAFRALLAKHRPETFGRRYDPEKSDANRATVTVLFPDRVEARIVPLADARLRAFLLDLLRLLATPSPGADEPHAESAESAEFESHAENAQNAETEPHAESVE